MANGDGTPEEHVMALVDSDLLDELLGTLDARARYAVEARFGLLDGEPGGPLRVARQALLRHPAVLLHELHARGGVRRVGTGRCVARTRAT